jgi:hypothetical protein
MASGKVSSGVGAISSGNCLHRWRLVLMACAFTMSHGSCVILVIVMCKLLMICVAGLSALVDETQVHLFGPFMLCVCGSAFGAYFSLHCFTLCRPVGRVT